MQEESGVARKLSIALTLAVMLSSDCRDQTIPARAALLNREIVIIESFMLKISKKSLVYC